MKLTKLKNDNVHHMNEDVQNKAESLVTLLLKKNNYYHVDKIEPYIVADSSLRKMLLRVVAGKRSQKILMPTSSEIQILKNKAAKLDREGWIALVYIKGEEIDMPIEWHNLSK